MKGISILLIVFTVLLLQSCEFSCSVGDKSEKKLNIQNKPVNQDGTMLYNGIELTVKDLKISKAYLVFDNGEKVPGDNFVDFESPVKLILQIDSGWMEINDRVWLDASEKVIQEGGKILLDEKDLFSNYQDDGITAEDAKVIGLKVKLTVKRRSPPTHFTVNFRVADKKGKGYVEGGYKLYSK
jgi:hypothetical protein